MLLTKGFNDNVSPTEKMAETILNYVWINREPVGNTDKHALCGVPLNYIDQAIRNARKYPDCAVNVWIDQALLDDSSKFFVDTYNYLSGCDNLKIQDLRAIPEYVRDRIFDPLSKTDIWGRVDAARVQVVAHCFKTTVAKNIFYSDFDNEDTRVMNTEVLNILDEHGIVVGGTPYLAIENGFMGFQKGAGETFLTQRLLKATYDDVANNLTGYEALVFELDRWFKEQDMPDYADRISVNVLKPMQYSIPPNPAHDGMGLYRI